MNDEEVKEVKVHAGLGWLGFWIMLGLMYMATPVGVVVL